MVLAALEDGLLEGCRPGVVAPNPHVGTALVAARLAPEPQPSDACPPGRAVRAIQIGLRSTASPRMIAIPPAADARDSMKTTARTAATLVTLAIVAAACADAGAVNPAAFTVRDSVGIEIVQNDGYAWDPGNEWRLAEAPEVDIGVLEGDSVYQMFRVSDVTLLADGRVAVANSGTGEIRVYDQRGRFLSATGRLGDGPGEFRRLRALRPYRGDSLVAWDASSQRISVLTGDGVISRTIQLTRAMSSGELIGSLAEGSFLLQEERLTISDTELQQQQLSLWEYQPDGTVADSIGLYPYRKMIPIEYGRGRLIAPPAFSPEASVASSGATVYVGSALEAEVLEVGSTGEVRRRIRWAASARVVEQADLDLYRARELAGIDESEERALRRAYLDKAPHEDRFPAYERIEATRDGELWVQLYRPPTDDGPTRWLVFDEQGRALGEIAVPRRFRIDEIGRHYVLGVERDELDVEHVRLYRIVRGDA